jgi:hypothetical protein
MKTPTGLLMLIALLALPASIARAERNEQPELRHELVHLIHIAPQDAEHALRPFAGRWGRLEANRSLGTLTIVDEPALVQKMLDVLAQIDVPRSSWQFRILLLQASEEGLDAVELGPLAEYPDVAREIGDLFRFDRFVELDSSFVTVMDGNHTSLRVGGTEGFTVDLAPQGRGEGRVEVAIHLYRPRTHVSGAEVTELRDTIVATHFETSPGQTTIVGASRLDGDDRALITIVETRPLD